MQQPDQFVALGRAPVRHRIGDQPDAPSLLSVVGGATLVGHLEEVGATISRVGLTSDEAPLGKPGDPGWEGPAPDSEDLMPEVLAAFPTVEAILAQGRVEPEGLP